jgi:hypothetical protein
LRLSSASSTEGDLGTADGISGLLLLSEAARVCIELHRPSRATVTSASQMGYKDVTFIWLMVTMGLQTSGFQTELLGNGWRWSKEISREFEHEEMMEPRN